MRLIAAALFVVGACGDNTAGVKPGADANNSPPPRDAANPDGAGSGTGSSADPLAALATLPPVCSDSGWCWANPSPAGTNYRGLIATSSQNIWLIGGGPPSYAAVMQWDGQKWTSHKPPVPAGNLFEYDMPLSISSGGPNNTWLIYGNNVEQWNGSTWSIVDTIGNGNTPVNGVWVDPNGDPWVTDGNGTVRRYHAGKVAQSWTPTGFAGAIWGTAVDDVFVTTLLGVYHYDGTAFTQIYGGKTLGSYQGARGDVWITGDSGIVHWDGSAATDVTPATVATKTTIDSADYEGPNNISWVAEGVNYNTAPANLVHWDGNQFTTTPIGTATTALGDNACSDLGRVATIAGTTWLVCTGGEVDALALTSSTPELLPQIVVGPFEGSGPMWAASRSDIYLGYNLRHWDGTTWTSVGQRETSLAGLGGSDGDELFGLRYTYDQSSGTYTNFFDHFDGSSWTSTQLNQFTEQLAFINNLWVLAPGDAIAVGLTGLAYHYENGVVTQISTGTTADLTGVWGSDSDDLSISGGSGTFLAWQRANPDVFTPDPTFPMTDDDLTGITHAGATTWIGASVPIAVNPQQHVYMKRDGGNWQVVPTPQPSSGSIAATSDTDVVILSPDSGLYMQWDGSAFDLETGSGAWLTYPSANSVTSLHALPDGSMMMMGTSGLITRAPTGM